MGILFEEGCREGLFKAGRTNGRGLGGAGGRGQQT